MDNIIGKKYQNLTKREAKEFKKKLVNSDASIDTFYKHCRTPIANIQFKYLKLYGSLLGMTWNDFDTCVSSQNQD